MDEQKSITDIVKIIWIETVPSFGNKIFYSLGFLSMISFMMLIFTGTIMVVFGPTWWLTNRVGEYTRSVHLWSTQAFILFILLHLTIVFLTSGFLGKRKLTWIFGSLMFIFALLEAELGYGLRSDFSSQWRTLQASDLYNGSGLGTFINNLNYAQIYGIHIILIPLLIITLLFFHYLLVRVWGIAKPYNKEVKASTVKANHKVLFIRGGIAIITILLLGIIFPSPYIAPITIKEVAANSPSLVGQTILSEITGDSDTATYFDSIDPYTYSTFNIYVYIPYSQYAQETGQTNELKLYQSMTGDTQKAYLDDAINQFKNSSTLLPVSTTNPLIMVTDSLIQMAKSGTYEEILQGEEPDMSNKTYVTRFLADTGVMDLTAQSLHITTDQYGMLYEEKGTIPPGAWWLAPLGLLDNTILSNDPNQDRDGAIILGSLLLLLVSYPYIPYLNKIPEKLPFAKLIWKEKVRPA